MGKVTLDKVLTCRTLEDIERYDADYANTLAVLLMSKLKKYAVVHELMAQYKNTLVFDIDGEFAGFFVLANRAGETKFRGAPILKLVYFKEEFRHQGYWRQALKLFEDFAWSRGFHDIAVITDAESLPLFVASGFRSSFCYLGEGLQVEQVSVVTKVSKHFLDYRNACRNRDLTHAINSKRLSSRDFKIADNELRIPQAFRSSYFTKVWSGFSDRIESAIKDRKLEELAIYRTILEVIEDNLLMSSVKGKDILLVKEIQLF